MRTEFSTSSPQAVKRWSEFMSREAIARTWLRTFMGTSPRSIIQLHRDLSVSKGDLIKYDLLVQLKGYGVHGSATLKGNEKRLEYHQDELGIDQLREGVNYDSMSQQRTLHDLRADGFDMLADFYARVYDETMLAQLAGTTGSNTELSNAMDGFAGNAITAPDTDHQLDKSGNPMDLDFITILREMAKTMDPIIRPIRTDAGEDVYALVLHPYQITSLKNAAGSNKWREIQAQADVRGSRNRLYTGAVGKWDSVLIYESNYTPRDTATDVNYGILLGAQAGHIGFGNPYSKLGRQPKSKTQLFSWFEDVDDYGDKTGLAVASIWGLKKAVFNSKDFATIQLQTTDAASG